MASFLLLAILTATIFATAISRARMITHARLAEPEVANELTPPLAP